MILEFVWNWSEPDDLWYFFQFIALITLIVIGIYLIVLSRRNPTGSAHAFFMGLTLFLWICILNQFVFLFDIYVRRYITGQEFIPKVIGVGGNGYIWVMLILFSLAFIPLMYPIEKYVTQSPKMPITKINITAFIGVLIPYCLVPFIDDYQLRTYIAWPGLALFVLAALGSLFGSIIIYLRVGFAGAGVVRQKAFLMAFGLIITYVGIIGGSSIQSSSDLFLGIIGPISIIIGLSMVLRSLQLNTS